MTKVSNEPAPRQLDVGWGYYGPVVATYASLADQPDRLAALDRDLLDFATRSHRGALGGLAEYRYEYLLVVARRGDG